MVNITDFVLASRIAGTGALSSRVADTPAVSITRVRGRNSL